MPETRILTAKQGDKLDLLIWREAGLGPADLTSVLEANPGLADLGSILPLGTKVTVTAATAPASSGTLPLVQLWD